MFFHKATIFACGILLPICLGALSIKTNDGKVYRNIKGVTRNPDGIVIISKTGKFKKLDFRNLPKEIQEKYKYDPEAAEEYRQKHPKQKTAYQLKIDRKKAKERAKELAEEKRKKALEKEKLRKENLKLDLGVGDSSAFIRNLSGAAKKFKASGKAEKVSPLNTVVIIKGDRGVGTGFIANLKGVKVVVSNAHVLMGNSRIEITDISGRKIKFKSINLAKDRDIAVYELENADALKALEIDDRPENVALDSDIVVYGNSLGEGVVTSIKGKLKGIGPQKIEVDSDFVQGNSGSPIVNAHGKVIGVATYIRQIRKDWTTKDTRFSEPRRFGVRVDNINLNDLQNIKPDAYLKDLKVYNRLLQKNKLAMAVLKDLFENMVLGEELYDDKELKALASKWNAGIKERKPSKEAIEELKKYLSSPVKTVPDFTTDYMKNSFKMELLRNEALLKVCDFVYGKAAEFSKSGVFPDKHSSSENMEKPVSFEKANSLYGFIGKTFKEVEKTFGQFEERSTDMKEGHFYSYYKNEVKFIIHCLPDKTIAGRIIIPKTKFSKKLYSEVLSANSRGVEWKSSPYGCNIFITKDKSVGARVERSAFVGYMIIEFVDLEYLKTSRRYRNRRKYQWARPLLRK